MSEVDRPVDKRLSVLDRPASAADALPDYIPSVKRWAQRLPDASAVRLAFADRERCIYLAPGELDGVEQVHVLIREAHGGSATRFPRDALATHGAGGISAGENGQGRYTVRGVVSDEVLAVRIGDIDAIVQNNVFIADVSSSPDAVVLATPRGEHRIRLGTSEPLGQDLTASLFTAAAHIACGLGTVLGDRRREYPGACGAPQRAGRARVARSRPGRGSPGRHPGTGIRHPGRHPGTSDTGSGRHRVWPRCGALACRAARAVVGMLAAL